MHEEIVDLLDKNDKVIRQISRDDSINYFETYGGYIRVVDCYIVNSKGELWVPRRTSNKRIAPNGLDFSIGEHSRAGETYDDSIKRGFQEEVGFLPDTDKLYFKGVTPPRDDIGVIQAFYLYHLDQAPQLNRNDFTEAQ